jgi:thioredoxin reductase
MKNKISAVIGGGNSGLESAIDLIPYASKIYVLVRGNIIKGDPKYQEILKKEPKVEIIMNAQTEEIFGDAFVKGLKYKDLVTGEVKTLEVSGVFVAIGQRPNSDLVKDLVKLDEKSHIIVDPKTQKTSLEGFWAAGDVTDSLYAQINTAIGDGVKALLNIYDYLNENKS